MIVLAPHAVGIAPGVPMRRVLPSSALRFPMLAVALLGVVGASLACTGAAPAEPTPVGTQADWPAPPAPSDDPNGCCCTMADELDAQVRWVARSDCTPEKTLTAAATCDETPKASCGVH